MRNWIVIVLLGVLLSCGSAVPFSKDYLGSYSGKQSSFFVSMDSSDIVVPAEKINITLDYDNFWLSTSQQQKKASYTLLEKTKKHCLFEIKFQDGTTEKWKLIKNKTPELIRIPVAPLPKTTLLMNK